MISVVGNADYDIANKLMASRSCSNSSSLSKNLGADESPSALIDDVFDEYLKTYAESYDTTLDSDEAAKKKALIKSLVAEGDTNKDGGLSMDELSSIDTKDNPKKAQFVNELISQFKSLDKNKDGILSVDEMQELLKRKKYSAKDLANMYEGLNSTDSSSNKDSSKNMHLSFEQNLINYYKKNDLSIQQNNFNLNI